MKKFKITIENIVMFLNSYQECIDTIIENHSNIKDDTITIYEVETFENGYKHTYSELIQVSVKIVKKYKL